MLKMATLTIDFFLSDPSLSLKGLSFKALNGAKINSVLYRDNDDGKYRLSSRFRIDGRTAKYDTNELIILLSELKEIIPFDKIVIKGHYPLNGEDILNKIKSNSTNT